MKIREMYQVVNELYMLIDTNYYVKNLVVAWEDKDGNVHTRFAGKGKKNVFKFISDTITEHLGFLDKK